MAILIWSSLLFIILYCLQNFDLDRSFSFRRQFNYCYVYTDKEAADKRKLVSKWHPTTKGTLRRNYRVPSKSEGRRRLKAIAALLSEDDYFLDATSHKVIQPMKQSLEFQFLPLPSIISNNMNQLIMWHVIKIAQNTSPRAVKLGGRVLMVKVCAATMLGLSLMNSQPHICLWKLHLFLLGLLQRRITSRPRN